jgi:hypothetical protein
MGDSELTAVEAAQNAQEIALERVPTDVDWGFCAYGDAPPGIGGGLSAFFWFADRGEMLDFIAEHSLFMNPPRSDLDFDVIERALGELVEEMRAGRRDDAAGMSALNKLLRHATQFTWIGTFRSLRKGETKFARQILEEFHREGDGLTPVSDEGLENFHEFLMHYCTG